MIVNEIRSPIRSAIRSPIGPSSGTTFALDAPASAIRAAILDPASYASGGWRLPGLAGARLAASARASVAMQQRVDGGWEFAPHNLLTNSDVLGTQSVSTVVGAQYTLSIVGTGSVALSGGATGTLAGTGASNRVSLTFNATTTSVTFTVTGSVTQGALCLGAAIFAYIPTTTTAVYGPAIDWLSGIGAYGLRSEEARTNSIRNSACVGGAVSTPPTNWSVNTAPGVNVTFVGAGVENGMPYMDVRWLGTGTATGFPSLNFDTTTQVVAANGQTWAASVFYRVIAGTLPAGGMGLTLSERDAGGGYLVETAALLSVSGGVQRAEVVRTFNNANTARTSAYIDFQSLNAVAYDVTIRVMCPQLEQGAFATSPILTYNAAATRAADGINAFGIAAGSAGTLIADFITNASGTRGLISLNDGSGNNRVDMRTSGSGFITVGNVTQASLGGATATLGVVQRFSTAYAVGSAVRVDNASVGGSGAPASLPVTDRLTLGDVDGGNLIPLNGHILRARQATRRVPNAELQALTA